MVGALCCLSLSRAFRLIGRLNERVVPVLFKTAKLSSRLPPVGPSSDRVRSDFGSSATDARKAPDPHKWFYAFAEYRTNRPWRIRLSRANRRIKRTYVRLVAVDQTPVSSLAVRMVLARLVPPTHRLKRKVPSGTRECGLNPSASSNALRSASGSTL